jgi:hypothetical protein
MKKPIKDVVVFVMAVPPGAAEQLRQYEKEIGYPLRILLLLDSKVRASEKKLESAHADIVLVCDFTKSIKISEVLLPYQNHLLAITCRSEQHMARFAEVLPHVPYLRTPTTESLVWASDKYEMRKRFKAYDKSLTPVFTLVQRNSKEERDRVIKKIGFPMIIKPTNLAASRFVSICYHEEELDKTLRMTFRKLKNAYKQDHRLEEPKIIAEEYIDGDMYSVDSYVDSRGKVYHCPLVKVTTGKKIGHDDFYNYLQMTPPGLKPETIAKAEAAATSGIHALGMRSTIAHTELLRVDGDWKIIEIAARMGGFRQLLHELSCDINHTLNDILIRIPKKPIVPKKCKGFAVAMKWFPVREGVITEMKGIKRLEQLESFHSITVNKKIGDRASFARNGGRSVFNLFLYNADRSKLLADIRRIEKMVEVKVRARQASKV